MTGRQIWLFLLLSSMIACSMAPVLGRKNLNDELKDGVYEGRYSSFPNSAVVRVTVENHKIASVKLLKHVASPRGRKADSIIPGRIIEEQATDVDAVSGATNSSRVIMNATQDALVQAGVRSSSPGVD